MRIILTLILTGIFILNTHSQNFTQAIGIRGGFRSGLTYRYLVNEFAANEFILKMERNEMNLTFLRVYYESNRLNYSPKLIVCKGFGAHIGYKFGDRYSVFTREFVYTNKKLYPVIGFDVYIGLEYRFEEFPVLVGIDCKPFFEFSTRQIFRFYLPDIAFALKYRF